MCYKNLKGVTLIEILIGLSILGFLFLASNRMMGLFVKAGKHTSNEFIAQNTARASASTVKTSVRNANLIFLLDDSAFLPENHTEDWNYIGIEKVDDCDEVLHYVYNAATKKHERVVVGKSPGSANINLTFNRPDTKKQKIDVKYTSYNRDNQKEEILFDTSFESLNAKTIVDWSGGDAKSLAYRLDDIAVSRETKASTLIGFTIDKSASVRDAYTTDNITSTRIYWMKKYVYDFINKFAHSPGVYVTANSFTWSVAPKDVKYPRELVGSDLNELRAIFDPDDFNDDFLKAGGGASGGDGLRILYHQMNGNINPELNPDGVLDLKKIYIMIMHGDNTYHTSRGGGTYYGEEFHDGTTIYKVGSASPPGVAVTNSSNPSSNSYPQANIYMAGVARYVVQNQRDADFYVVSVGEPWPANVANHNRLLREIGGAFGFTQGTEEWDKHMFTAHNAYELELSFESVVDSVSVELAELQGPKR